MSQKDKPAFTCSHGCAYTAWELEIGMSEAYLLWLCEQEERQYHLEADLAQEEKLARDHIEDIIDNCEIEWPWYADTPYEVVEPEIIGG